MKWMRDLGLDISIDGVGNVIATMPHPSGLSPVMTGSHIDTVATGGRFDGNLGVLAGLEVIESVMSAGVELVDRLPLASSPMKKVLGSRLTCWEVLSTPAE